MNQRQIQRQDHKLQKQPSYSITICINKQYYLNLQHLNEQARLILILELIAGWFDIEPFRDQISFKTLQIKFRQEKQQKQRMNNSLECKTAFTFQNKMLINLRTNPKSKKLMAKKVQQDLVILNLEKKPLNNVLQIFVILKIILYLNSLFNVYNQKDNLQLIMQNL
ncbi:unnamed protein product (macronuclear) [Paramecium tetraurelia]|uniref:Transmembrane protein n=1 Tax=Paramecium tetraurelia TaxID=5888 RepID=A0ECP0_PARTE|nr:uncharacterized protein GSPATT00003926001 [Paramecium tetraurelia]CAK93057.1 unnamed protein product [Paramecium tetraurelia]|eukprot:XP_001460454.1 hypothetical protein (macronuclear) [Paramecium tetraurelia strain d4-2]